MSSGADSTRSILYALIANGAIAVAKGVAAAVTNSRAMLAEAIYSWSFIVALLLFSVGDVFSVYEGWHQLHFPEPPESLWIAIGVLVFAVVAEGLSLLGCLKEINKVRHGRKL